jgi:hypothetical protein
MRTYRPDSFRHSHRRKRLVVIRITHDGVEFSPILRFRLFLRQALSCQTHIRFALWMKCQSATETERGRKAESEWEEDTLDSQKNQSSREKIHNQKVVGRQMNKHESHTPISLSTALQQVTVRSGTHRP